MFLRRGRRGIQMTKMMGLFRGYCVPVDMSMRVACELAALGREHPTLMPLTTSSGDWGRHLYGAGEAVRVAPILQVVRRRAGSDG